MTGLKTMGTLDGNLLVSMPESLLHDLNKLLRYYHENEEQKKHGKESEKIFLSPEQFAKIVGLSPRTIREWCKSIIKPASIKHGRLIRIDKNLALQLLEEDNAKTPEEQEEQELAAFLSQPKNKKIRKRVTEA